jgi:hypothetical protein
LHLDRLPSWDDTSHVPANASPARIRMLLPQN